MYFFLKLLTYRQTFYTCLIFNIDYLNKKKRYAREKKAKTQERVQECTLISKNFGLAKKINLMYKTQ